MDYSTYESVVDFAAEYCYRIILSGRDAGEDYAQTGKRCATYCIKIASENGWDTTRFSWDVMNATGKLVEEEPSPSQHLH